MAQDDPILDAKTIAQLAEALDKVYGLTLPTSFPPDSQFLNAIWAVGVAVQPGNPPIVYLAEATAPLAFGSLPVLQGCIFVRVRSQSDFRPLVNQKGVPMVTYWIL
jgi:hypothetical protein